MEITCSRCHQTVQTDDCYCPACGLPQLLYTSEGVAGQAQPEQWSEAVRDASEVSWRPALRAALILAVPAGLLCSIMSPVSILCFLWISAAASWAVVLYMRSQRSGWVTIGAGARIGLVTGLLGAWTAAAATGISLFVMRFILHQGKQFDDLWQDSVQQRVTPLIAQQWASMGTDSLCCRRRGSGGPVGGPYPPAGGLEPHQAFRKRPFALRKNPTSIAAHFDSLLHNLPRSGNPSYHPAIDERRENYERSPRQTRPARERQADVRLGDRAHTGTPGPRDC